AEYKAWLKAVGRRRKDNYAPPRMIVGSPPENTTVLTRQDWPGAAWGPNDEGHCLIDVASSGPYDVKLIFFPADIDRTLHLRIGSLEISAPIVAKATQHTFTAQKLPTA